MNIIICDDLYLHIVRCAPIVLHPHTTCMLHALPTCLLLEHSYNMHVTCMLHALPTCMLLNTRTTCMVHALPFPTPVQHACNTHVTGVLHAC